MIGSEHGDVIHFGITFFNVDDEFACFDVNKCFNDEDCEVQSPCKHLIV